MALHNIFDDAELVDLPATADKNPDTTHTKTVTPAATVTKPEQKEIKAARIQGPEDKLVTQLIDTCAPGKNPVRWYIHGEDIAIRTAVSGEQKGCGDALVKQLSQMGLPVNEIEVDKDISCRFIEDIMREFFNEELGRNSLSDSGPDGENRGCLDMFYRVQEIANIVQYNFLYPTEEFFQNPIAVIKRGLPKEAKASDAFFGMDKSKLCYAQGSGNTADTSVADIARDPNRVGRLMFVTSSIKNYVDALKKAKPAWGTTLDAAFTTQKATFLRSATLDDFIARQLKKQKEEAKSASGQSEIVTDILDISGKLVVSASGRAPMPSKDAKVERPFIGLCIDESGSMLSAEYGDPERMVLTKAACKALIESYREGRRDADFGAVAFSTKGRVICPVQSILLKPEQEDQVKKVYDTNWPAGGGTSTAEGIEQMLDQLKGTQNNSTRTLILITDGQPTSGKFYDDTTKTFDLPGFLKWAGDKFVAICREMKMDPATVQVNALNVNPQDQVASNVIIALIKELKARGANPKSEAKPVEKVTVVEQILSYAAVKTVVKVPAYYQVNGEEKKPLGEVVAGQNFNLDFELTPAQLKKGVTLFVGDQSYPVDPNRIRQASAYEVERLQKLEAAKILSAGGVIHGNLRSIEGHQDYIKQKIKEFAGQVHIVAVLTKYVKPQDRPTKDWLDVTGQVQFDRRTTVGEHSRYVRRSRHGAAHAEVQSTPPVSAEARKQLEAAVVAEVMKNLGVKMDATFAVSATGAAPKSAMFGATDNSTNKVVITEEMAAGKAQTAAPKAKGVYKARA